ncbi:hypothetical protein PV963_28195 [Streptomyces coeruleorubidus]|uniref:hypothetical protein n=1 Tax=Streptomyces coeruleorubidus TaxID=116188 RepID=UPI00237F9810|nr:hypothetical protein [Streptomyces coeruleorubidus]WDV53963.1 hypothetical protein PV963_28195 [Streptomyces coeruleorubidus]
MLRHELQPGKLVAGTVLVLAGVLYAGDAGGAWQTPWFAAIPLVTGGLCLAGVVGFLTGRIRRRRTSGRTTTDEPGPDTAA